MMQKQALSLEKIMALVVSDEEASPLLCRARECAEIYLLVAELQKGCDGMGELAMLKEEFKGAVGHLGRVCKGKDCLFADFESDLERFAKELSSSRLTMTHDH